MNQVQLIGRMAREPELRRTEKGTPVVSFALAVDRRFQRDTVDFVDCVAWRGTAEFVNKYFHENRKAPTISEIADGVGVARSTTHRYMQDLSDNGLLDYSRGILSAPESAKMKTAYIAAPLVGSIQCGCPEEEQEYVEEYVSLPVSMFGKGDFYILRAKGDSMVDAGIEEDDLLVIERNCPASEGDIVVALDPDNQNTLKRYAGYDEDDECYLLAYENEAKYPGEVIKVRSFKVQGVARHVIKAL